MHDHTIPGSIDLSYVESLEVGGAMPARATAATDAEIIDLAGPWAFHYAPRYEDLTPAFAAVDFDDSGWDAVPVPSHWQLTPSASGAYGWPQYTNERYPIPMTPPFVPDENPAGEYRRRFAAPVLPPGARLIVRFLGVDSVFEVFLNGVSLGTAMGSRLTHEFDGTDAAVEGENLLAVRVHQWSAGSFVEDQDMWWLSGIFRPVEVEIRPAGGIDDHVVVADFDPATGIGTLRIDASVPALVSVPELGLHAASAGTEHVVGVVRPWSAEDPHLYDGVLWTDSERIALRIGFRRVEISEGLVCVNGSPLFFRGVNRHEWNAASGRTLSAEDMKADVELMKRHNINAVRTSHYPPHPLFLDLCDEYGIWVMDECDAETHGFYREEWRANPMDDPRWRGHLQDRMQRTVRRDINHPSVIMWSLGNEAGAGCNLAAMAEVARGADPTRLVHYENDYSGGHSDVYSRMYSSLEDLELIGRGAEAATTEPAEDERRRQKPFLAIEYAHAMGTGPGGLAGYDRVFRAHRRLQGGFVWQWIDAGIANPAGPGYLYGGDFGERVHDGNYVIDGLVRPDRTPAPALAELAAIYAPVSFELRGDALTITSEQDLAALPPLEITVDLQENGVSVSLERVIVADLGPGSSRNLPVASAGGRRPVESGVERWIVVTARMLQPSIWAEAGHVVARRSLALHTAGETTLTPSRGESALTDAGGSRARGVVIEGMPIDDVGIALWRAPTDNDLGYEARGRASAWKSMGLDELWRRVRLLSAPGESPKYQLTAFGASSSAGYEARVELQPRLSERGVGWSMTVDFRPHGRWPVGPPLIGLELSLPRSLDMVRWLGLGPEEVYPDAAQAGVFGWHARSIEELSGRPVRPQESGRRSGCREIVLTGDVGETLSIRSPFGIGFTYRPWPSRELDRARHWRDLPTGTRNWLTLDIAQRGLGTASAGPDVRTEYESDAGAGRLTLELEYRAARRTP